MLKVSGISHKMGKKSDRGMAWLIFQKIYLIYYDINNIEARNYVMFLTSMSEKNTRQQNKL